MKVIPLSEFRKLSGDAVKEAMPFTLTYNGDELAIMADPEGILVLQDLHPRVQTQLKAQYKRARGGMPAPEKVFVGKMSEIKPAE